MGLITTGASSALLKPGLDQVGTSPVKGKDKNNKIAASRKKSGKK